MLTTKAAVDLDQAVWTLNEGAARHHRHFLVDQMNRHCQPALLVDFGLKPGTVTLKMESSDCFASLCLGRMHCLVLVLDRVMLW